VNRQPLLGAVREIRDTLRAVRLKGLADEADQLLQDILDAGMEYERMIPRTRAFIRLAQDRMNGRGLLPAPRGYR